MNLAKVILNIFIFPSICLSCLLTSMFSVKYKIYDHKWEFENKDGIHINCQNVLHVKHKSKVKYVSRLFKVECMN